MNTNDQELAPEVEAPRREPFDEVPRWGAPHPTPCSCDECFRWWTQEDKDDSFIHAAQALLCEQR